MFFHKKVPKLWYADLDNDTSFHSEWMKVTDLARGQHSTSRGSHVGHTRLDMTFETPEKDERFYTAEKASPSLNHIFVIVFSVSQCYSSSDSDP